MTDKRNRKQAQGRISSCDPLQAAFQRSIRAPWPERIGHVYINRVQKRYETGTSKQRGYYPVYIRYEDTNESVFLCWCRWRREGKYGCIVIDQHDFYSFAQEGKDE